METLYIGAASTDANIPISLGIPAITVGWGGKGGGEHTIHEWYEPVESWKGPQRDLLCCWRYRVMEIYESISFHA